MATGLEKLTKVQEFRLVRLNLCDGKPFDIKAFDDAMVWVRGIKAQDGPFTCLAQFLIVDDIMYVFPPPYLNYTVIDLRKFNEQYPEVKLNNLQASGAVELENDGRGHISRTIISNSNMPEIGQYGREGSSKYMNGRFKDLIGYNRGGYSFTIAC